MRGWRLVSRLLPMVAPVVLKRRVARGKEDPLRWREKLGEASAPRPDGRLIWLHAVSLGEVMALRGLVAAMAEAAEEVSFLITTSTLGAAQVLARQMPPRTLHQFLPIDAPQTMGRFLDHWRPDLVVWAEQDLWPVAVYECDLRAIPMALVNGRMNETSFAKRLKMKEIYGDLLARLTLVSAQDEASSRHLTALGAHGVEVGGPMKAAAPALGCDPQELAQLQSTLAGRRVWLYASAHPEDEPIALGAAQALRGQAVLILAPRQPKRGEAIAEAARAMGLQVSRRALGQGPDGVDIWVVDSLGEMGLWYRLADKTVIGGSFGAVEGHNPWEPAALGSAILHGDRVANFPSDFQQLQAVGGARQIAPDDIPAALGEDLRPQAQAALTLVDRAQAGLGPLALRLLALAGVGVR